MKKAITSLLVAFLFSFSLVLALPVTFEGTITVDGQNGTNVPVRIVTNLEDKTDTFTDTYFMNIAGDEGTETRFYFWSTLVENITQPAQASLSNINLSFNRTADGGTCTVNDECVNVCCSGTCKSSCGGGGGGGSSGGGGATITYACSDNKDNDNDGKIDYPNDPGCTTRYDNDETDTIRITTTITPIPVCANETQTCWDGSQIVSKECINETKQETNNTCPEKECENELTETCHDGTVITKKLCENGKYVPVDYAGCPAPPECTGDQTKTCGDGTSITTKLCENGKYINTSEECKKSTWVTQLVLVILVGLAIGGYLLYKHGKNKKLAEEQEDEV